MSNNFDVLIKGGMVVTGAGMVRADLGIRGEKIAELGPDLDPDAGSARSMRPASTCCRASSTCTPIRSTWTIWAGSR